MSDQKPLDLDSAETGWAAMAGTCMMAVANDYSRKEKFKYSLAASIKKDVQGMLTQAKHTGAREALEKLKDQAGPTHQPDGFVKGDMRWVSVEWLLNKIDQAIAELDTPKDSSS